MSFLAPISFIGPLANNTQLHAPALNLNIALLLRLPSNYFGFNLCSMTLVFFSLHPPPFGVTILMPHNSANLAFHACTKHIKVDYHFVRDKVIAKTLVVYFIFDKDNLVDIFIKPTASSHVFLVRTKLNIVCHCLSCGRNSESNPYGNNFHTIAACQPMATTHMETHMIVTS